MMGRRRFLDALARKTRDIPSFGTGTSIACRDLMDLTGAYFPDAHCDAEQMAALAITGHTQLGFDVVMPLFSVCHEAAAMGCNVQWGSPDQMPESGPPIFSTVDDIVVPDDLLSRPGCRVPLDAIALLRSRLGDDAAVCGKVFGPWTQAYHYFGVENFLIMTIDAPDTVRRIMDVLLPVTIRFAQAQIDAGADCLLLADHATSDLCSPDAYREFLLPVHTQLAREIDVPLILHICGKTDDRIQYINSTGLDCFHWDTRTGTSAYVRSLAADTLALMGGISNYTLLRGTPDEVHVLSTEAEQAGINVIGPECAIPLATPLENLRAITRIT